MIKPSPTLANSGSFDLHAAVAEAGVQELRRSRSTTVSAHTEWQRRRELDARHATTLPVVGAVNWPCATRGNGGWATVELSAVKSYVRDWVDVAGQVLVVRGVETYAGTSTFPRRYRARWHATDRDRLPPLCARYACGTDAVFKDAARSWSTSRTRNLTGRSKANSLTPGSRNARSKAGKTSV